MNDNIKKTPQCVGIIMDGNRRWAKERGLTTLEGHKRGYEKLKDVVSWLKECGVRNSIFYAFSTENWNRAEEEVGYLMTLIKDALVNDWEDLMKKNVRIRFIGQTERFSEDLQKEMKRAEEETAENTEGTIALALSYGGRAELVAATHKIIAAGIHNVTEEDISKHMWTAGMPDPDMVIRTSGEQRLSGFLAWQSVYSELFFTETHWPALEKEELRRMLDEYARRKRRHGR